MKICEDLWEFMGACGDRIKVLEIGGTCHNDKPGLWEGGERVTRGRKEKRKGEKAGPATMTSRAYKREREEEM